MKENSELKPVKLRLKIDLVSYPARAEGLGEYDNEHIPLDKSNIYTLYDCFWVAGANYAIYKVNLVSSCENSKIQNPLRNELISYLQVSLYLSSWDNSYDNLIFHFLKFGLVSLFNDISTFVGYLMAEPFSQNNCCGTI